MKRILIIVGVTVALGLIGFLFLWLDDKEYAEKLVDDVRLNHKWINQHRGTQDAMMASGDVASGSVASGEALSGTMNLSGEINVNTPATTNEPAMPGTMQEGIDPLTGNPSAEQIK